MTALSPLAQLRAAVTAGSPAVVNSAIARLSPAEIHEAWDEDLLTVDQAASALAAATSKATA